MTTQSEIKAKLAAIETQVADAKKMFCDLVKEKQTPRHLDGVFLDEPKDGDIYHVVYNSETTYFIWNSCKSNYNYFTHGNCYISREAAQWHLERQKVMADLLRCESAVLVSPNTDMIHGGVYAPGIIFHSHKSIVNARAQIGDRIKYLEPYTEGEDNA